MKNRIVTLLLCLTLVFTMAVPSFAAETGSCKSKGAMVFTMGDSIAAGCKSGSLQNAYNEYRSMRSDESKYSLYTSPVDGEKHNHWYINAVPYSFVSKFARSISANEETSMNGAHPGLRARDYCYLLGLADKSIYAKDYWMKNGEGNQLPAMKNSSDGYKYGIANADVIVIELGGNDISSYAMNNADKLIEIVSGLMSSNNTTEENAILADLQGDAKALETADTEEKVNKRTFNLFADLAKLKETSKPYIEILDFLVTSIGEAAINFRYYWDTLMNYVSEHKKADSTVLAVGIGDPLKGLDSVIDQYAGWLGGEGMDMSKILDILNIVIKPFVMDMNNHYRIKADKYDYTYVAMPDISLYSTVTGEYDPYDDVYLDTEVSYMLHPHHKDTDKIFKAVQKAYKKEMLKKGKIVIFKNLETKADKCKHANSEIQNVVEATYFNDGYTGDKVCTDCGRYFYKGKKIDKLAPSATTIKKLTKGEDSFTVKWVKKDVEGYQVQYSTNAKFSKNNKKVTVTDANKKLVKNLKSDKKYYVRVRSFQTVQNDEGQDIKVFSAWSESKAVTTK